MLKISIDVEYNEDENYIIAKAEDIEITGKDFNDVFTRIVEKITQIQSKKVKDIDLINNNVEITPDVPSYIEGNIADTSLIDEVAPDEISHYEIDTKDSDIISEILGSKEYSVPSHKQLVSNITPSSFEKNTIEEEIELHDKEIIENGIQDKDKQSIPIKIIKKDPIETYKSLYDLEDDDIIKYISREKAVIIRNGIELTIPIEDRMIRDYIYDIDSTDIKFINMRASKILGHKIHPYIGKPLSEMNNELYELYCEVILSNIKKASANVNKVIDYIKHKKRILLKTLQEEDIAILLTKDLAIPNIKDLKKNGYR